jgi:hypothetical protein
MILIHDGENPVPCLAQGLDSFNLFPVLIEPSHDHEESFAASTLQELANTPVDSEERFRARALLPGMAGRLRAVGPSIGALLPALGETDDAALTARYGGEATTESPAEAVYRAIGRTITISGRCVFGRSAEVCGVTYLHAVCISKDQQL